MTMGIMSRRNALALICFSPLLFAQRLDKEQVWQDFLKWLKGTSFSGKTIIADVSQIYHAKLVADGFSVEQATQRMVVIDEFLFSRTEGMAIFFDDLFTNREDFFTQKPNAYLAQVIQGKKPGTALDISMGQGRNSLYLAQSGWEVTGFDISDEGLSIAQHNAEKAGVKIKTILSGYQDFDFGKNQWDLIAMIYAFFPIRNEIYVRRLVDSIRPGGILVFEHGMFTGPDEKREEAGKVGIPTQNELLKIFGTLRVLRYEESTIIPDFGSSEPTPIVRLLAQKS